MARRRPNSQSSVYISTDPQNNVPIGVAGQGVAIGRLGILLFEEVGPSGGVTGVEFIGANLEVTPATVPLEFNL